MGVVWRALDERLERTVAVKQILTQPGLSEIERVNIRQRAMREAKNAARLQHPNAIVVFDIAEHGGDPCLVMEYLPSQSLSAVLGEQATLQVDTVTNIGEQVASALVAAHRAGIVHRDVKPGNVLIDDSGVTKITDFGISRAAGDLTLTQTGLIGGTPAYLAPELARGADPAPSSDVFALGATLYHAIEGQPPYGNNTNQLALLYTAANGKIIPPRQAGNATALLMNLLRAEPDERPTMSEAKERLAAIATRARKDGSPHAGTRMEATAVSPPLSYHGAGRKPAVPGTDTATDPSSTPAQPPWQRTGTAEASGTAQGPMTTFDSVPTASRDSADGAAPESTPHTAATPEKSGTKRKAVVWGSAAAAVLVVAAAISLALGWGGQDSEPQAGPQQNVPAAQPPPPSPSTSPEPDSVGTAESSGTVEWQPAGQLVIDYFSFPSGAATSWDMLTPAAQKIFGDRDKFEQYWSQFSDVHASGAAAYKRANNPDGSVDIKVSVNYGNDTESKTLRIVSSGGQLLIDADTRSTKSNE